MTLVGTGLLAGGLTAAILSIEPTPDFDPTRYEEQANRYHVEILRDPFGVPHIYGQRDADVAFGLAYAHAEDDFGTIQKVILATRGISAQHYGAGAAASDYLVSWLGVWEAIDANYEDHLNERTRMLLDGYANGLNLYAARHRDEVKKGLVPVRGADIAAGFVLKSPIFYRLDKYLEELFQDERHRPLVSDTQRGLKSSLDWSLDHSPGSNAIAVSSSRTSDGYTRLVINSHQPLEGAVAWYEFRARSEEGLDVAGGTFPGSPLMLHGHNRDLGWAATVNFPDLVDVFVLQLHPDDDQRYRLDDEWRDMESKPITIWVKVFGRIYWPVRKTIEVTEHGPVVRRPHGTYAVRYVGRGEIRQVEQFYRLNRARNFDEWRSVMGMQAIPNINFVYADRQGNIGMFYNGKIPIRREGLPYETSYQPGDRSDLIWEKYVPFDALPHTVNPPSGLVFNTNSTPFEATDGRGSPNPQQFSDTLGIGDNMSNRAKRILQLARKLPTISETDLMRIKYDKSFPPDGTMAGLIREILSLDWPDDPVVKRALDAVRAWDFSADANSRATAVVVMTCEPILEARGWKDPEPDIKRLFSQNAHHLQQTFGRPDPLWSEVNRLRRGDKDYGLGGAPGTLRAIHGKKDEDGRLKAWLGDSLIQFVEWGPKGEFRSRSIHHFGASNHPDSPHYTDQMELFVAEKLKSVPWNRADIDRIASAIVLPNGAKSN
ncbi:MAG: penicillin acylase family protein [Myxococcota bacterium]